jgi:hypothetical protein
MAATSIKLHVLSTEGPHFGSRIDFAIILSGASPLSELVGGEALQGTMTPMTQESFRTITFSRGPACLGQILVLTGDTSTIVADRAVRINSTESRFTQVKRLTSQQTTSSVTWPYVSEVLLNFTSAQLDDLNVPRFCVTVVPGDTTDTSSGRATLIVSRTPCSPNRALLLGWLARQDSVTHGSRSATGSTITGGGSEASRNRIQHYTTLLRRDGPYAPNDNIALRTGVLLSDLDILVRQFQAWR